MESEDVHKESKGSYMKNKYIVMIIGYVFFFVFSFHIGMQITLPIREQEQRDFAIQYAVQQEEFRQHLSVILESLYTHDSQFIGGEEILRELTTEDLLVSIESQLLNYTEILKYTENYLSLRNGYLTKVPVVWPVKYNKTTRVTSGFGYRLSPISGEQGFHTGIDLVSHEDNIITATADGIIVEHYPPPDGYFVGHDVYGGMIEILHVGGISTVYGHLKRSFVSEGDKVEQGQEIGIIGNTGHSVGAHLHYEVRRDGVPVNPIDYLNF